MNRLIYRVTKCIFIFSLPFVVVACSDNPAPSHEQNDSNRQSIEKASTTIPDHVDMNQKTALAQIASLIETVRDSKNHDEPLTEKERADIEDMLAKVKEMQSDPEAVRQVEALKSTLTELKGLDESQISFDTQLLP